MGHYVLGHVWQGILFASVFTMLVLYGIHRCADWLIARFQRRFGFDRLDDIASMPLIVLLFSFSGLILGPVSLAFSRHVEHEADRFGLEITKNNYAAASACAKLQIENLGVPRPGLLYKIWQATHPPAGERIDFYNEYRPWETGQPLVYGKYFDAGE
jgi:Zn-dependent protease with chaperone function